MNIKYFQGTDTLYIEFRNGEIAETRDLPSPTAILTRSTRVRLAGSPDAS